MSDSIWFVESYQAPKKDQIEVIIEQWTRDAETSHEVPTELKDLIHRFTPVCSIWQFFGHLFCDLH